MSKEHELTELLDKWREGDEGALNRLIKLTEPRLHAKAKALFKGERPGHTLQPTAIINELYLELLSIKHVTSRNRNQFFCLCATIVRRVLVSHARRKKAIKRDVATVSIHHLELQERPGLQREGQDRRGLTPYEIVALGRALDELEKVDPRLVKVIECRVVGGLTIEETAEALGVASGTVKRDCKTAKTLLTRELEGVGDGASLG